MKTRILIVMGVSGAGKTTVGRALAAALNWSFIEGDDLHPAANVAKMRRGQPLTDGDRDPWLDRLRTLIADRLTADIASVIACSALKQTYRDRLTVDPEAVRFVYLYGEESLIRRRLAERRGHFMPVDLFDSQRLALEPPPEAIAVDAAWPVAQAVDCVVRALELESSP